MHRRSFIVDSNRVIIHSSFVHAQVREKIAGKLAGLRTASDALRAKHSAQDDERAAAADAAARLLAAKEETAKVRSERREGRRRRADAISSEIATCAVSDRALGELNTRLDQQREAFEDKQRDATSSTVRFFLLIFERAMRMTVFYIYICTDRRRPRREVPRTRGARQETPAASIGAGPRRRRGRGRAQTSAQTRGTLRQRGAHGGVVGGEEARDARRLRRRRRHTGEFTFLIFVYSGDLIDDVFI